MIGTLMRMIASVLPEDPERLAAALEGRHVVLTIDDAPDAARVGARLGGIIERVDPWHGGAGPPQEPGSAGGSAVLRLDEGALGSERVRVLPRHAGYGSPALRWASIAVYVAPAAEPAGPVAHADVIAIATLRLG